MYAWATSSKIAGRKSIRGRTGLTEWVFLLLDEVQEFRTLVSQFDVKPITTHKTTAFKSWRSTGTLGVLSARALVCHRPCCASGLQTPCQYPASALPAAVLISLDATLRPWGTNVRVLMQKIPSLQWKQEPLLTLTAFVQALRAVECKPLPPQKPNSDVFWLKG